MGKLELEVKILNIDKDKFINKIESLGAKFVEENLQTFYTYDLPSLYGRFIDLLLLLNNKENDVKYEVTLEKLKLLFWEIDNLKTNADRDKLSKLFNYNSLTNLLEDSNLLSIINSNNFIKYMKLFHNNPNKWIRVRKTNDITKIAVKHILADNNTHLQQMLETEIKVEGLEEANKLLNALGYVYKSSQEKYRVTYMLNGFQIDIDSWPGIPTFFEVEGSSEKDLDNFLKSIGYSLAESVSCTADELYNRYEINWQSTRELKFQNFK